MARYLALAFLLFPLLCLPLRAADLSAEERLRALEKAVERLQQRNAELESEVHQLKSKSGPTAPSSRELSAEKRSKFVPDTKSYVETEVKPPLVDVHPGALSSS